MKGVSMKIDTPFFCVDCLVEGSIPQTDKWKIEINL